MKYCIYCGEELKDEAIFCSKCGKKIEDIIIVNKSKNKSLSIVVNVLLVLTLLASIISLFAKVFYDRNFTNYTYEIYVIFFSLIHFLFGCIVIFKYNLELKKAKVNLSTKVMAILFSFFAGLIMLLDNNN